MPSSPSPSTADAEPSTWRRRLSYPPVPRFRPTIPLPTLRTALLGYLGEIELALRNRLMDAPMGNELRQRSGAIGEANMLGGSSTAESDSQDDGQAVYTSALPSYSSLRRRVPIGNTESSENVGAASSYSYDTYLHLLSHLSALREEASSYLPSFPHLPQVPYVPNVGINREWLRNLPMRLSMVDSALPGLSTIGEDVQGDKIGIESARERLIDLVHALLPSEEWAGWERLGWEEQDLDQNASSLSRPHWRRALSEHPPSRLLTADVDDDDEPEYLFPNRTPASTQTLARRRAVRSKSVGAIHTPYTLKVRPQRSRSEAFAGKTLSGLTDADSTPSSPSLSFSEDEEDEEDREAVYILTHPELSDTKFSRPLSGPHSGVGPSVAEALRRSSDGRRLVTYDDLPAIWRNNEHIHAGYHSRFIPLHLKTGPVPLIKSAFRLHNETVNIHSHLIPTLFIFCIIPLIILKSPLPNAHPLDTTILILYLIAATSCLISSAGWHVLSGCASRKWFEWGACVDYIGISWLIAASFGTVVYNGFYCQSHLVLFYCSINFLCGGLGSYLPFQRWFNERRNKHLRISFFLFLCFAMVAPMAHMFFQYGRKKAASFIGPFMYSILVYVIGLLFYAFHFPECKWPGKFDLWGSSHQLWHMGIVIAIALHYRAIFVAHSVRHEYSCAISGQDVCVADVLGKLIGWSQAQS
ncbi:hypothetical protein L204_102283 [Cryptococcus depauperatus]